MGRVRSWRRTSGSSSSPVMSSGSSGISPADRLGARSRRVSVESRGPRGAAAGRAPAARPPVGLAPALRAGGFPPELGRPDDAGRPDELGFPPAVGRPDKLGLPPDAGRPDEPGRPDELGLPRPDDVDFGRDGRPAAPPRRSSAIRASSMQGPGERGATSVDRNKRMRATPTGVALIERMFGGVLLSHTVTRAVPSALQGLASGFGMGPGVSPALWPPKLY